MTSARMVILLLTCLAVGVVAVAARDLEMQERNAALWVLST